MARTKLNPFHRRVGDAASRQSEYLVELSEEGVGYRIAGEVTNIQVVPQYANLAFPISGGGEYSDQTRTRYTITIDYVFGTDGGFWEQLEEDKEAGNMRYLSVTTTTEDVRSMRLNGGRASRYNDCHIETHTQYENANSSENSPRMGQVTLYAPVDSKAILRQFRPVQGV